jgi:hypothetical protein
VLTAFANASTEDHPVLSTGEWKAQEERLDSVSNQIMDVVKSIAGSGSFVETDALGKTSFQKIARLEAREAIRRGATIDEANRIGFAEAAAQTNLYQNMSTDLDPRTERTAYVKTLAAANGLNTILFDNPEWDRFVVDQKEQADKLEVRNAQLGALISGNTDIFGETANNNNE